MHASKAEGARRSSNGLEEQIYFMNVCYYIVSTSDCDIEILIIKDIFLGTSFLNVCYIHIVTGRLRSSNRSRFAWTRQSFQILFTNLTSIKIDWKLYYQLNNKYKSWFPLFIYIYWKMVEQIDTSNSTW